MIETGPSEIGLVSNSSEPVLPMPISINSSTVITVKAGTPIVDCSLVSVKIITFSAFYSSP